MKMFATSDSGAMVHYCFALMQEAVKEARKREEIAEAQKVKDPLEMADKLESWLSDPKTVPTCSMKIVQMCKKDAATNRKKFIAQGALEKLVRAMQGSPEDSTLQASCCAALTTLTGGGGGGKRAADAGALPCLVRAVKTVQRQPFKALLQITANDPDLVEKAKEAGAKDEWLMPKGEGGEDDEAESPDVKSAKKE